MAREGDETRHYSYVDVLERVSDGVHVHVVPRRRKTAEVGRANDRANGVSASQKKNDTSHKKRHSTRHNR